MTANIKIYIKFGGMRYTILTTREIYKYIKEYISLYPKLDPNENFDVHIRILPFKESYINNLRVLSSNPRTHYELENGFGYYLPGVGYVFFRIIDDNEYGIDLLVDSRVLKRNYLYKLVDKEFNHPPEYLGQILHEILLIPSILLYSDSSIIIHSSSILNSKNGKVIMFSGTGGIGKTFLEMYFIMKYGFSFFADDMSIVDRNGITYPNYAFPKIYKYNIEQFPDLEKIISMKNRSILDKIHWKLHSHVPRFGNYTRRKINPSLLPNFVASEKGKLWKIYILFRDFGISDVKIETLSHNNNQIIANSLFDIIKIEYSSLFSHLTYHRLNRNLLGIDLLFNEYNIRKRYEDVIQKQKNKLAIARISKTIPMKKLGELIGLQLV